MYYRISCILLLAVFLVLQGCREKQVNWSEDVAPILYQHCVACHRPGEVAPFSLLTYRDAAKKAKTIAKMVLSRSMPPWPADPGYTHFLNERILSDSEIDIIQKWVQSGAPEGDSLRKPPVPVFSAYTALGKPDLILQHAEAFPIAGDNQDRFVAMKFPFELPQNTWVRAIEFIPGNRQLVHHMNGHLISYEDGKKNSVHEGVDWVDEAEIAFSGIIHRKLGLLQDDGTYPSMSPSVVNYLPGVFFQKYPEEIGGYTFSRKGALYIKNMHYGPSPVDTTDHSKFHIYFSDSPPKRPVRELILGTLGLSSVEPTLVIPPETVRKFITRYQTQEDISILTLNPHMHLTGVEFKAYALSPSGDTLRLIHIPVWDFRWQYFYTFPKMIKVPKGYMIVAEGIFDNTSENPNNPNDPPQTVQERNGSMRTTDEMFQFIITWLPYQNGDEKISLNPSQ